MPHDIVNAQFQEKMKTNHWGKIAAALLSLAAYTLPAQTYTRYDAQPGKGKVSIDGTSTFHDWTVQSGLIGGHVEIDQAISFDPAQKKAPSPGKINARAEISVPARSLKSGKKTMDEVMHETLKEKQHPKIQYRLLEMVLKEAPKPGAPYVFDTKGALTVAGVTRTNSMVVTMTPVESNKLKFTGTTPMKMTDFGMKPPSPAVSVGLIKTGDDVKVTFDWLAAAKTADAAQKAP